MDAEKTDEELWNEALRTAETLRRLESGQLETFQRKMALEDTITKEDIPTDYIADAQILTMLLLRLEERGAEVT